MSWQTAFWLVSHTWGTETQHKKHAYKSHIRYIVSPSQVPRGKLLEVTYKFHTWNLYPGKEGSWRHDLNIEWINVPVFQVVYQLLKNRDLLENIFLWLVAYNRVPSPTHSVPANINIQTQMLHSGILGLIKTLNR